MNKKIVHSVFENIVEKYPTHIAVEQEARRITYRALNEQANTLAHMLRNIEAKSDIDVKSEVVVGGLLPASIDYVVSVLGVFKAGEIFMPVDIDFPKKRFEAVIRKTAPRVIITDNNTKNNVIQQLTDLGLLDIISYLVVISSTGYHLISVKSAEEQFFAKDYAQDNLPLLSEPDDGNYLVPTSGSTGEPKLILCSHKCLSHLIHWEMKEFALDASVKVSQFSPATNDVIYRDIFTPLLNGGTVCIPNEQTRVNTKHLLEWIEKTEITVIHTVPSFFRLLLKEIEGLDNSHHCLPKLQRILMVGEELYGSDVIRWMDIFEQRIELVNLYGTSEIPWRTFYRIPEKPAEANRALPLGHPIANTSLLIINDNDALCRIGEIGEIYIKTPFRTKGYYKAPELTARSFIQNPLTTETDLIYKTGDLGRYRADRSIEYIGRLDRQVKINALRIELSEVESAIRGFEAIEQTVVMAHKTPNHENRLICYYTEKQSIETAALRNDLVDHLPDYMIPSFFVRLDEFPLNINGKINKRALPKPEALMYEKIKYVAPANATEETLAKIWGEVLDLSKVGVNNPFFEIGGNSLNAIRIISRLYKTFAVEVTIQDFFSHANIRQLAELIEQAKKSDSAEIVPVNPQNHYALSHAQKRLWILEQVEQGAAAYNIPRAWLVEGPLNISAFQKAFQTVVDRHESLRTGFIVVDGEPQQQIHQQMTFRIETLDLSQQTDAEAQAKEYARQEAATPFDLSQVPLLRVKLLKLPTHQVLLLNMHHIISDAGSLDVLAKEVLMLYSAYLDGKDNPLPPLKIQYKDFSAWQNTLLASEKIKAHQDYWLHKLAGDLPVLDLPSDYTRPTLKTFNGQTQRFELTENITNRLNQLSSTRDVSLFMVLVALVKVLLYRYTMQKEIIVGTPMTGRSHVDLENQMGFYVNMLALRDTLQPTDSFAQLLEQVKQTCTEAYVHQIYPFDKLVEELALERDMSRAALFDVMVVQHTQEEQDVAGVLNQADLRIADFDFANQTSKFDLTFTFIESSRGLQVEIEYNTDLFKPARIEKMQGHFEELIASSLAAVEQPICHLNILSAAEHNQVLYEFNETAAEYPRHQTIQALFEQQAANRPDYPAVAYEDIVLTYQELNAHANRLAHTLIETFRLQPEECVGVLMEKSEWMIVSILGILKAGGAYMPIEPSYPQERIQYMLADTRCQVVISDHKHISEVLSQCSGVKTIEVATLTGGSETNPKPLGNGQSLAYVIYTSGSTGQPKGSLIEHHSVLRLVLHPSYLRFEAADRIAQTCALTFDVSVFEIWGALVNGCCLCLPPEGTVVEAARMKRFVKHHQIKTMWLTTSLFNQLVEADISIFAEVKNLIIGGEKLFAYHINKVRTAYPDLVIINGYGPTENTCFTAFHHLDRRYDKDIPIGRPVANSQNLILDENHELVPIGVAGEICAGGDGVARGYLNASALTAEKFIPHPFAKGERLYRIGDIGRWTPEGIIEFLGRNDDQVKVRGYRIELGEIDTKLLQHPNIQQAVVMVRTREDGFNKELIAYFTGEADHIPNVLALRKFLGQSLPGYMIPTHFVHLQAWPLNASGKVNRSALPSPEQAASSPSTEITQPRNNTETHLLTAWQKILGKEEIGIYDNYFELGGDSIKAIQIVSQLHQAHLQLEVRDIFQYPQIAELATYVVTAERTVDQASVTGTVPLTAIQTWFFQEYQRVPHHFNQCEMLYAKQRLHPEALRAVLVKIQTHHDALRMCYSVRNNIVTQINQDIDCPLDFEIVDLTNTEEAIQQLESYANTVQASINLATGPLMKVVLFQLPDGDRLLIVIHHLVIDGLSWRILAADITQGYQQYLSEQSITLPAKTNAFKHWAEQIHHYSHSETLLAEKAYWNRLDAVQTVPLPRDYPAMVQEARCVGDLRQVKFSLSEAQTNTLLTQTNQAYNTEINDILLTALARAMQRWHGDNKTLIALEGHGRENILDLDISRTVGWFTSLYPVLLELPDSDDLGYQIKYLKEMLRGIPNKGIGYGLLKYVTAPEHRPEMAFNSQPQISFNYLGQFDDAIDNTLFQLATESTGYSVSPQAELVHDLAIEGVVSQHQLQMSITYNHNAFKTETIEKLATDFQQDLLEIMAHCTGLEETEITPSDIDFDGLSIDQLDAVLDGLNNN